MVTLDGSEDVHVAPPGLHNCECPSSRWCASCRCQPPRRRRLPHHGSHSGQKGHSRRLSSHRLQSDHKVTTQVMQARVWVGSKKKWFFKTRRQCSSTRNHVVGPQTEPDLLEAGRGGSQTPKRPLDQACFQVEPSSVKQAQRVPENKEDWPRDGETTSTYNQTGPTETTTTSRATRPGSLRRKTA